MKKKLKIPNAKTLLAIQKAERGEDVQTYKNTEELFKDLGMNKKKPAKPKAPKLDPGPYWAKLNIYGQPYTYLTKDKIDRKTWEGWAQFKLVRVRRGKK